jgi:hypothetical protein
VCLLPGSQESGKKRTATTGSQWLPQQEFTISRPFSIVLVSSLQLVFFLRVSDSHSGPSCRCISPAHPLGAASCPAEQAADPVRSIRRHKVEDSTAIACR